MVEDYLEHHGVLGMHWGIRKDGGPQGYNGTYSKGTRRRGSSDESYGKYQPGPVTRAGTDDHPVYKAKSYKDLTKEQRKANKETRSYVQNVRSDIDFNKSFDEAERRNKKLFDEARKDAEAEYNDMEEAERKPWGHDKESVIRSLMYENTDIAKRIWDVEDDWVRKEVGDELLKDLKDIPSEPVSPSDIAFMLSLAAIPVATLAVPVVSFIKSVRR